MGNAKFEVLITDHGFADVERERTIIESAGGVLRVAQCKTPEEVIRLSGNAYALLVQWAPINAEVLSGLNKCKLVVRYGIGVDNVDLNVARECGIAVCNVPDYCIDEVADHTLAMALGLVRQLHPLDKRFRQGTWKPGPIGRMSACSEMNFATAGFGRIAREVLGRASCFKFKLAAHDPYLPEEVFEKEGVTRLTLDELFKQADVLSLHTPLTEETKHMVNAKRLSEMKSTSILINTSRGPIVDTFALAKALKNKQIAYAGIDVFEKEPLEEDHPLLKCDNVVLTPHLAWHSESSLRKLQMLAAEEIVRGLRGEALKHQVNK